MRVVASAVLVLVMLSPVVWAHPEPGSTGGTRNPTCGGFAPAVVECTTGNHLRTLFHPGAMFEVAEDYRGTLRSTISYPTGKHVIECDFDGRSWGDCRSWEQNLLPRTGLLSGPLPGEGFIHTCESLVLGGASRGGSGSWSCGVFH